MNLSVFPMGELMTNCCLVADGADAVILDPAADGDALYRHLVGAHLTLRAILLTHGHYDHIGGLRVLAEKTGAPVYMGQADRDLPETMTRGRLTNTLPARDGDTLTFGNLTFTVISTPGHTPGSVCYLCENTLFCGDTLFAGSCGRTDLPLGSMEDMMNSLRRIGAMAGDLAIYSGHGESTTLSREKAGNPYLREAMRP